MKYEILKLFPESNTFILLTEEIFFIKNIQRNPMQKVKIHRN